MKAPRPPKAPRLRLSPLRSAGSAELDGKVVPVTARRSVILPGYTRWDTFEQWFGEQWDQGEHVTLVGTTGSGKTTLARQLLKYRDFVIVLATKQRDESLYKPLRKLGYEIVTDIGDVFSAGPRVIFRPGLNSPDRRGMEEQSAAFAELLARVYQMGGYCLYADEVRYLTQNLGLRTEMETLWLQGRSLGVTLVAATQRPVSIPLLAFDQAEHLFYWRNADDNSVKRMAEIGGGAGEVISKTVPRLPEHESLYVNTRTDYLTRTRVIL